MKFTPKKEEELKKSNLLEKGVYDFEILKAEDTISKAGNEMIKLLLKVFAKDGSSILVNDYLLESVEFKIKHCCEAIGASEKYATGDMVADDFISGTGQMMIKIDKGKLKDDGSGDYYPDRNSVADYLPTLTSEQKKTLERNHGIKRVKDALDDEVPF